MSAMEAPRVEFTAEMKSTYKILIPGMLPIHFEFLKNMFRNCGYDVDLLSNEGRAVVDTGLKYVHNDTCYPALLVIGQFIDALQSGKYDVNKTALLITQTGGGCRASNYIHLLRKALEKAGMPQVPVISLNPSGMEKNSGFKFDLRMIREGLAVLSYADLMMLLRNQIMPYEVKRGESEALLQGWIKSLNELFLNGKGYSFKEMQRYMLEITDSFAKIETVRADRIKVGIVGEIYVKYSSLANNHLEQFLYEQGCEVYVPGLVDFIMFIIDHRTDDVRYYGGNALVAKAMQLVNGYLRRNQNAMIDAVKAYPQFRVPPTFAHVKELAHGVIDYGCKMGEGWLLTAEMVELIDSGFTNIICAQPFGCLPNHIVGKGMIRKLMNQHPEANIVPIDYDPGATRVNQENRIKLMLAVAAEELQSQA